MTQQELNKIAFKYIEDYKKYMKESSPYEIKGIFHSELLMVVTLAKELGVEVLMESGRARGQSTELLARFAKENNIAFHSIESSKDSDDVVVAESRLSGLPVTLHYADSLDLMPRLMNDAKTLVIIDGPKGHRMWDLGMRMLEFESVVGVCMHDAERGSYIRGQAAGLPIITTDDKEYVEAFKHLDGECWKVHPWGPYESGSYINGEVRHLRKAKSYEGTLMFIPRAL